MASHLRQTLSCILYIASACHPSSPNDCMGAITDADIIILPLIALGGDYAALERLFAVIGGLHRARTVRPHHDKRVAVVFALSSDCCATRSWRSQQVGFFAGSPCCLSSRVMMVVQFPVAGYRKAVDFWRCSCEPSRGGPDANLAFAAFELRRIAVVLMRHGGVHRGALAVFAHGRGHLLLPPRLTSVRCSTPRSRSSDVIVMSAMCCSCSIGDVLKPLQMTQRAVAVEPSRRRHHDDVGDNPPPQRRGHVIARAESCNPLGSTAAWRTAHPGSCCHVNPSTSVAGSTTAPRLFDERGEAHRSTGGRRAPRCWSCSVGNSRPSLQGLCANSSS